MKIDLDNASGSYGIIYTDPAWPQTKGGKRDCRPKQGKELDYKTLTLGQIQEIQRKALLLSDEKHNVFMWTIDKYLHEAESMMKEMGYKLHARMIWDKENGIAPAFTVRFSHEYLLWFYRKGAMLMPCKETRGKFTTVLREPATQHSRKPRCAYEMIDAMFPGTKKLELFARCEYKDWDCWGDQTDYFKKIGENVGEAEWK